MTNFPTSLDSFSNPSGLQRMNVTVKHSVHHGNANDAIEAIEAKVGVDSSAVTTSLDYRTGSLEDRTTSSVISAAWESMQRELVTTFVAPGTGGLRFRFFTADHSGTASTATVVVGTAAGATPTLCRLGLYLVNGSGDGTLVASTPNDTALFNTPGAPVSKNFSVSYAMIRGQRYATGILIVTGAATPTLAATSFDGVTYAVAPRVTGFLSGQTDLPANFTAGGLGTTGTAHYMRLS